MPPGGSLSAGDTVLFALSHSRPGQRPSYVPGGDSVLVSLTNVADLGVSDPGTGQALFHLRWEPLGQSKPTVTAAKRVARAPRPQRPTGADGLSPLGLAGREAVAPNHGSPPR